MSIFRSIAACVGVLFISACGTESGPKKTDVETLVQIGTRSVIQWHGQELIADITEIAGDIVTSEIRWHGDVMSSRDYYRGLYPVSGLENGYQFEVEYDEDAMQSLFPLAPGKSISFEGRLNVVSEGATQPIWVYITVTKEKFIKLPTGNQKVYVVDIVTEYTKDGSTRTKINQVYYSPELMMVLKSVMKEDGHQSYWRVTNVEQPKPGETTPRAPQSEKPRRSGTVMI